ncbi:MAG: hypothetical protein FJ271_21875 [Planctomycetes bacterium]|nr:hypothetical protein [Planctomycetota bacterium]
MVHIATSAGIIMVAALTIGPTGDAQDAPANPLAGKRFLSLQKLTGGERRDGTVNQIHWRIDFKDKTFEWLNRDVIVTGKYTYDARTGIISAGNIKASLDAKTGILTWGKHKYRAVKSPK